METPSYDELSARLRLLAHPERLRILDAVRRDSECVCHLEALLGKPQPYVSQQLRLLRDAGIIADEKQGQNVFYRLNDDGRARLAGCRARPSRGRAPRHDAAQAGDRLRLPEVQRQRASRRHRNFSTRGLNDA